MSLQTIVEQLTAAQLDQLVTLAIARREALRTEERIPLWVLVEDRMTNIAAFHEDQYAQAIERMVAEVRLAAQLTPEDPLTEMPICLELKRQWFSASMVDRMLAIGNEPSD
jgi:hypothetical protein